MKFLILLSAVAIASCSPISQDESVMRLVIGNFVNCMNSDLTMCLKENALKATERLGTVRQLKITEGITILNNGPKEPKSLELSAEPEVRQKQLTDRLWESTSNLLKNSELELSWDGPSEEEEPRALDTVEGRGKKKEIKKKLKILVPLLILAKLKAGALVVASIVVIAISIAKIALMAKIAFLVKAIAILKTLLHKKHHEEEHSWIPPHHEEHVSHGWDGWSRSRNEANNLAYSAYAQV